MLKILVTGSNGQLGNELRLLSEELTDFEFLFTDYQELDITDPDAILRCLNDFNPDWVINCAAYTAVDKAEQEPEKAALLNTAAPGFLAEACSETGARMIQISTDYVFDGKNFKPYREDHPKNAAGVYARTKSAGEDIVMEKCSSAIILRTSWLYSTFGANFVKTIRRVGKERGELKVVADQIGSPTWAHDLADAIVRLITINANPGIFHYSNDGVCSWFDFAKAIIELSDIQCNINPTDTAGYPLPSPRPWYSVFDKTKFTTLTGQTIPYWRDSLKKCIALLNEQS